MLVKIEHVDFLWLFNKMEVAIMNMLISLLRLKKNGGYHHEDIIFPSDQIPLISPIMSKYRLIFRPTLDTHTLPLDIGFRYFRGYYPYVIPGEDRFSERTLGGQNSTCPFVIVIVVV